MRRILRLGALALCILLLVLSLALWDAGGFPAKDIPGVSMRHVARAFMDGALLADATRCAAPRYFARIACYVYPALLLCALYLAPSARMTKPPHRITVYTSGSFVSHPRQAPPIF